MGRSAYDVTTQLAARREWFRPSTVSAVNDDLAALLPGWIEPITEAVLLERADGDRQRLVEIVRDAWERGELRREDGMWWCPFDEPAVGEPQPDTIETVATMRTLCASGRPDEALRIGFEKTTSLLADAASETDLESQIAVLAIASLAALLDAGRIHAVIPAVESLHRQCLERRASSAQAWLATIHGIALIGAGRILDARRSLVESRILARRHGNDELIQNATDALAVSYAVVGESAPPSAAPNLPARTSDDDADHASVARRHAWHDASSTNLEALANAAEAERRAGRDGVAALLACELALLGEPELALRVLESVGPLEGDLLPLWAPIAKALAANDAASIMRYADRLEELGLLGLAAAFTLRAVAIRIDAAGEDAADDDDADADGGVHDLLTIANRRARQVQLGDQFLAQFRRLLPLRDREHEIAQLAADGLTNKEIAEHLVISLRTVENHLYRVYDKLGIEGRDDLRPLLRRD